MANRRIQRGKELSDYLRAMNEDVTKLNNRNYVTSIAANAIGSDQIGSDVVLDNKTISSSNYLPGISGWMIDGFGNSEFANVLVRGDINAYSGTIGYWNISQPLVSRTFGDYVLRGTLLESSNLGLTDDGVETGTYVGLFKSYVDVEVSITSISRTSEIATAIVLDHNYSVGDYVRVSIDEDSSFNTDSAVIVDTSSTSFKYYSAGSDVVIAEATGFSILAIRDIAGLYLRDYSKAEFDYGYFSNTGIAYVSAEDVNLIENPSFEYIDSGLTPVSSTASWTAASGSTFSIEQFNDGTSPQYQFDSSYGGKVAWSSALSTYFAGRIDYLVGTSYNIFNSGRVLYLGTSMFPLYVATRSNPTGIARYNNSGSLYWRIDTFESHGLSGGDTVLLDFAGYTFDTMDMSNIDFIPRGVTGGETRTYTVLSSPAPTSDRFYVDANRSFTDTMLDGTLVRIDNIAPVNTVSDLGTDAYGSRPAYVYKVVNAAFNLSEIRFRFGNGSTVNLSDVISIDTRSNWDTVSNKYLISDPTLYALGYNDASIGIPPMYKSVQTIVDANALQTSYRLLDPTNYAAGTDIYIDIPAWMYTHNGAGYVSASPTKISSFTYILDNLYLSTTTKTFFGGSLPNVRWASSTVEDPSYDTAQASIEGTKQWIDVNLDTQTAYLDYFNYVGFKQANFSRSMLVSPNITTSDSISAKIVIPTDHETLTITSGTYRYINNADDYIDLSSSLKTVTGDRDTGFELIANRKRHSGVSDYIIGEEYALIAGYWDESSSKSVIQIKSKKFVVSGGGETDVNTDRLTIDSNGVVIAGNLTVNGTTTTVNSTTVTVDDKNIELASTASPSDALADGAGITVKGTGDKTWTWVDATDAWTSNQDINIISPGTSYEIAGTPVLNATTLGSGIVNSSLTKIGPLSGGTAGYVAVSATGALTSTSTSATMTTLMGFTTTVTSGTPVVLTNASTYYQQFTGSTAQIVTLPVTSTLALGWTFHIVNNNTTGDLTVNSSGGNLVITVIPGTTAMVTCIATAGTGAANWESGLTDFSTRTGTGDVVLSVSPTFTGTVNTSGITAAGVATFNNNISAFGTTQLWANQQLSLGVRNGINYAGNLVQYSLNDTTITGGVTARGLLWAGTTTGAENNFTYNLSATTPFLTSSTATFTVSTVQTYNPFAVGQRIIVSGASQAQYNGSWISTAVGGSSGAWTVTISSGSGTTPFTNSGAITATGTIALEPAAFFRAPSPGSAALVIKAAGTSGNATDPFRFFDSAGALKTYITSAGDFVAPAISAIWSMTSSAQDVTVNAMRARTSVASGYRANLQTWESSTTVLAGINATGQFFTGRTSTISGATTAATAASASSATVATFTVGTVSTVNPYAVGQVVTTAGFTAETYFNSSSQTSGTFYVTAIGGSSGAWTVTVLGSGFTVASATVQGTITIPIQTSITPTSAGTVGLVVRGTTSQAADLQQWQDSTGVSYMSASAFGGLSSNLSGTYPGRWSVGTGTSGTIGLVVRGSLSQSVDLFQIQNFSPNTIFKVDQNGFMVAGGATVLSNALISASIFGATQVGLAIRGTSGQTADLLVLQNNSTTSVSGFDSASNLFVNNTYRGFSTIAAAPANTTYWKIATLPLSGAGTYDHMIIDAIFDDGWGSANKVNARILLANRNAFTYRYYLNGTVRVSSRLVTYTEADGSVSIYLQASSGQYTSFSYNITHGITGVTIFKNPASTTTAPTGTLSFDTGNIATYVPQMYVPYTGAPQIQGNSLAYLTNPVFTSTSTTTPVVIFRGLANQVEDLTEWQNSGGTVLGGSNANGQLYSGSTAPIITAVGGTIQSIATGANPLITMASAHGLATGDLVTLAGTTGATYDGTFVVATVPLTTTFTITSALTTGQAGAAGTLSIPAQASITSRSPGTIGAIIRGATSQTTNLIEFRDSFNNIHSGVLATGFGWFGGSSSAGGQLGITAESATNRGMVIKGAVSQTADTLQIQDSSANIIGGFSATGRILTGGSSTTAVGSLLLGTINTVAQQLGVVAREATTVGAVIRGAASQTADLLQAQDSAGNNVFRIQSGGFFVSPNGGALGGLSAGFANTAVSIGSGAVTNRALVLQGVANQIVNIQEYRDGSGVVIGGRSAIGQIFTGATGVRMGSITTAINTQTPTGTTLISITTASAHGIQVGQSVTIAGVTPAGYNGLWFAQAGTTGSTLVINIGSNPGAITVAGTVTSSAQLSVVAPSAQTTGVVIQAAASQTANLTEWQSSAGAILARVHENGDITARVFRGTFAARFQTTDPTVAIQVNTAAANQVNDLIQYQSSAGTVLSGVTSIGQIYTGSTVPTRGSTTVAIPVHTPTGTTNITLTLSAAHNILVGQTVEVAGVTPTGYNGVWTAQAGTTGSTLVLNIGSNPGAITVAGVAYISPQVSITPATINTTGLVIKGLSSQVANLLEVQSSTGAVIARVASAGDLFANRVRTLNSAFRGQEANGGGQVFLQKNTSLPTNPGGDFGLLYFRDGTNAGTLRLASITGASGIEETIVDNISSTGSTAGAQFVGAGGVNTAGTVSGTRLISTIATGTAPLTVTSTTQVANLNAATSGAVVATVTGTNSTELVRGNMADNDQFRILVGGTATNAGFVEIATADDGTEPIYVRQYTGVFTTLARTATLLDGSGNTSFPGSVTSASLSTAGGLSLTSTASTLSVNGSVGTSGQVLTSAGAGATPTWTNPNLVSVNATAKTAGYTLATTDYGTMVQMNGAFAFTVGTGLYNAPVGTQITLLALTAGVTVAASGAGVVVNSTPGLKLRAQYSTATLICLASSASTCTWLLTGDLSA